MPFTNEEITILVGLIIDVIGTVWVMVHRYGKREITQHGLSKVARDHAFVIALFEASK
jgi:hypothetical protein